MSKFEEVLEKFYCAHQITKTKNLVKMWYDKDYSFNTNGFATKCVSDVFELVSKPWCRATATSSSRKEKCFFTKSDICLHFGKDNTDSICGKYIPESQSEQCQQCYKFCLEHYFCYGGEFRLKSKKKKSLLSKIQQKMTI